MTPSDTNALISRHLEGWLGSDAPEPTLLDRIAAMIAEAESARDKLWADGNATLKHERDTCQREMSDARRLAAIYKSQAGSMKQARDDAVQAAHLIAEELAECKRRVTQ